MLAICQYQKNLQKVLDAYFEEGALDISRNVEYLLQILNNTHHLFKPSFRTSSYILSETVKWHTNS